MRALDYIAIVKDSGGYWSAYRQGALAFYSGTPKSANAFRDPHVTAHDWRQGWEDAQHGRAVFFRNRVAGNRPEAVRLVGTHTDDDGRACVTFDVIGAGEQDVLTAEGFDQTFVAVSR